MGLKVALKKKQKPEIDILEVVEEYHSIKEQEKIITARKEVLASQIKEYAKKVANKDSNGSYYLNEGTYSFGAKARNAINYDLGKAKKFFTKRGLWKDVVKYTEELDNEQVEALISRGIITTQDVNSLCTQTTTYSVDVKVRSSEEEEMPMITIGKIKRGK
jgi:hypothetical protein